MNKVMITGRFATDPEIKQTQGGVSFVRFRLAVDRPRQNGKEKEADFLSFTAWRQTAEFIAKWFSKGKPIEVEGTLRTDNYTDRDGNKRYETYVLVDRVNFTLGGNHSDGESHHGSNGQRSGGSDYGSDLGDFEEILSDGETPF